MGKRPALDTDVFKDFTALFLPAGSDGGAEDEALAGFLRSVFRGVHVRKPGETLAAAFMRTRPDIVLSDACPEGCAGPESLREIKDLAPLTPVVVMTRPEEHALLMDAVVFGMDRLVPRPVRKNRLLETLHPLCVSLGEARARERAEARCDELGSALNEARARFRDFTEGCGFGLWQISTSGRSMYLNRAMCELLGLGSPEEVNGRGCACYFTDEGNRALELVKQRLVAGDAEPFEVELVCATGESRIAEAVASPVFAPDGSLSSVLYSLVDVTARKTTEQELRHAQASLGELTSGLEFDNLELERTARGILESERIRGEFYSSVSHEIRTPINSIVGMSDLLLDGVLTAEQREQARMVKASAESLLSIINDMLDFSRMESGGLELDLEPFNLRTMVADAVEPYRVQAAGKHIGLYVDVSEDLPQVVIGDAGRILQVLGNLLSNSVKFTSHGRVSLKVDRYPEKFAEGGSSMKLLFMVSDTGIGIPSAKIERMFESIAEAGRSEGWIMRAAGFGLPVAAKLVELMGGGIIVRSEVDKGSSFSFDVLVDVPMQQQASAGYSSHAPGCDEGLEGAAVLMVCDRTGECARGLAALLKAEGMRVARAAGRQDALDALRRGARRGMDFSAMVVDNDMDDIDGFDLAAEAMQDEAIARSPVIVLLESKVIEDSTCNELMELGIDAYLSKPVDAEKIVSLICEKLNVSRKGSGQGARGEGSARKEALEILVVEDNLINQKLAVRVLEKAGHIVDAARNGQEALDMIRYKGYDIVVMDVQMPVMDGIEATSRIREMERGTGRWLPIVAMTAHALKGDRERCLKAGMDGYIPKPIKAAEFVALIEGLGEEGRRVREESGG